MKKVLSMLLAVCLLLGVFSASALAEPHDKKAGPKPVKVEEKHEKPAAKHEKPAAPQKPAAPEKPADPLQKARMDKLNRMVDDANRRVEQLVRIAQRTPYNDIDWLQAMVASVTAPVFAYAESIGAKVQCTYTTYYIDGQYVDVDPLRVINVIPSGNGGGNNGGGGK